MSGTFYSSTISHLRALTAIAVAGALAVTAMPAQAALIGTLSFSTPAGIVSPNDAIDA